jgi:hypothetical protein
MDRRFRDILMMDYATKNTGGLLGGQQGATGGLLGGLSNINPNLLIGANILGQGFKAQIHLVLLLLLYFKLLKFNKH